MKFPQPQISFWTLAASALLTLPAWFPSAVEANPSGEIVINGSFKIEDLGSTLKIIQESKNGIIHWDDFSIKANEITQFIQPSSSASVLNRVTGSARSEILGQLLANGNIWLINPNGILVGPGARVDVGGLILSTLDISNDDFLMGGDMRFAGASQQSITNFGTINAASGDIYVMAHRVENHGFIGALDGRVVLAADNEVLIKQGSEGNVFLSGQVGHGHVLNNGEVVAADVAMMARGNNVYAMAVQNNGIVRAQTAEKSGGRVRLVAQGGAGVEQAGTVNVDGTRGGRVEIDGGDVRLLGATTARGTEGGGEIVVGSLSGTRGVNVGAGAVVDASTLTGNGGKVEMAASDQVRTDGLISAASAQGAGGTVQMSGAEALVGAPGEINVSGGIEGGSASVEAIGKLQVEGAVVGTASAGSGGSVRMTGAEVELASTALVDVSGSANGGTAFIGGGFGGRDTTLRNALTTTVAPGAIVNANGVSGNGGRISLWADGDMFYRGNASVRGGINGGFIEVSGKNQLTFAGLVDLAGSLGTGGTLLLDPVNVRISQGAVPVGAIDADALVTSWDSGNVVVHTGGAGTDLGNIVIDSNVNMEATSQYSLSLFAHNNITVAPNVGSNPGATRILNRGTGNINLVSGWDGTGEVLFATGGYDLVGGSSQAIIDQNGTPSLGNIGAAQILAGTYGEYGLKGAIELNPNSAFLVNIASSRGETNLFGHNITMTPGDATGEFVQVGWFHNGTDGGGLLDISGDINVYAKGSLVANNPVLPGTSWRYLQIGHGGQMLSATANVQDRVLAGDITVNVTGGLRGQSGGTNNGWFKIGHGGKADGADVRVNTYGDIDLSAGGMSFQVNGGGTIVNAVADNYIQVGHGGVNVRGEHAGNVNVTARTGEISVVGTKVNTLAVAADTVTRNFFQIGHGGFNSDHPFALPIDFNSRSVVGDEITTIEELTQAVADGEDIANSYATALGLLHRRNAAGAFELRDSGKLGHAGNISVLAQGNVTLQAGGRSRAYAQIGHGGVLTAGEHGSWNWDGLGGPDGADGNISVVSTNGAISLTRNMVELNSAGASFAALGTEAFVQIGHGGVLSAGGYNGNINVNAGGGDVSLHGGQSNAFAKIGHGGIGNFDVGPGFLRGVREWNRDFVAGDILGNITVQATGDLIQRGGFRSTEGFAQIGHGGYRIYATDDFEGSTFDVVKGNDMNGDGISDTFGAFKGDISVNVGGMVDAYAGQKNANHIDGADPRLSGQEELGMAGNRNFVMIGHGGIEARSDALGAIVVVAGGDVRMESTGGFDAFDGSSALSGDGDTGIDNFARIGHGGRNSEHTVRNENPFDGDQRSAGMTSNSVETMAMFVSGGNRQLMKISAMSNTEIAAGTFAHFDSPIGWQVDVVNPGTVPTRTAANPGLVTLGGTDTASSLRIVLGTAIFGSGGAGNLGGIPAGAVVTSISPDGKVLGISADTTATLSGVSFLTSEAGTNVLTIDNPADRSVTTATPSVSNGGLTLNFNGSDTVRNLFLGVDSEIGGTGITPGTRIASIDGLGRVTLSSPLTGTPGGVYTFAGNKLATQMKKDDYFGFENQTQIYQITDIQGGTGANVGERIITFKQATSTAGLHARLSNNNNLIFLSSAGVPLDPIQEQAVAGRNEVQRFNLPAAGPFTLEFQIGGTAVTTADINVNASTPMDVAIRTIDAALELRATQTGIAGSNFFQVVPGPDGSIRVQFQGAQLGNRDVGLMEGSGVEVEDLFNGAAAGTSYLFTELNPPAIAVPPGDLIGGVASNINNPVFSNMRNPEFPEFINTVGSTVNYALGWNGAITIDAQGDVLLTSAQRRNLETNPYQANSPLFVGAGGSFTTVPRSAVRSFVQIGHGGSDTQAESHEANAGQNGAISIRSGGQVALRGSDFVRELENGQHVTITTQGTISRATTAQTLPTNVQGSNIINLAPSDSVLLRNIGVGSIIRGVGIPGGAATVTQILGEREIQISANTNGPLSGVYTFERSALSFSDTTSPDSRENFVMIGHGGMQSATGAKVTGAITVDAVGDVTVEAGRGTTGFAMIGHGGRDSTNNALNRSTELSGDINVLSRAGGIAILGGSRDRAFAMIGHGGNDFVDAGLSLATPLLFLDDADNTGSLHPIIFTLTDPVNRSFLEKGEFKTTSGAPGVTTMRSDQTFEVATILGDINVESRGLHSSTLEGLTVRAGQKMTGIVLNGDGVPNGEGDIVNNQPRLLGRFAQIGHGGSNIHARIGLPGDGDISVRVLGGNASLLGGVFTGDAARIGHGGREFSGVIIPGQSAGSSFYGNIDVHLGAGYDLVVRGGDAPVYDSNDPGAAGVALLRTHRLTYFYDPDLNTNDDFLLDPVAEAAAVTALDNALRSEELLLGLPQGTLAGLSTPGAVNAAAHRRLGLLADRRAGRESQLDGDPAFSQAPFAGPASSAFYPLTQLQTNHAGLAQIGHGGSLIGMTGVGQGIERWEGNITVNGGMTTPSGTLLTGRDVKILGGDGKDNFAQIGHGGFQVRAGSMTATGAVTVNAGHDLILDGGDYFSNSLLPTAIGNSGSYAQLGHMFTSRGFSATDFTRSESSTGRISASAVRDIVATAGGGQISHAMIGSGATFLSPTVTPLGLHSGDVSVRSGRDIIMNAAEIREADAINDAIWTQIGDPVARQRLDLQGLYSFVQIGHGGPTVSPRGAKALTGSIDVSAWGNLVAGGATAPGAAVSYTRGALNVPVNLTEESSRGWGAYAKIGHGDYFLLPPAASAALQPGQVLPSAGIGFREGNIRVATGMDLYASGLQIGHIDPVLAPNATYAGTSSTSIAVSRRNPFATGTGRLITNWSLSNYKSNPLDLNEDLVPGGDRQTILPTSFNSGLASGDVVRIYMPDRAYGRGNGSALGATLGLEDSNFMQGRQLPIAGVTAFGTMINGIGYDDPESDNPNPTGLVYPTLRGSTLAESGIGGNAKGDELLVTEFTMTRDARGLPVGNFDANIGTSSPAQTHDYGLRYMIYYAATRNAPAPAPFPGGGGSGSGGTGGGGLSGGGLLPPLGPIFPVADPSSFNSNSGLIDRYTRQDELVDGSIFSFESWRQGDSGGDGYWVFHQQGVSSVILPEDRPVAGSDNEGLPFQVFDIKRLVDWENGVLVYNPATGFGVNPRPSRSTVPSGNTGLDPFGFGGPGGPVDDEEERRRAQEGQPSGAPQEAPPADPFGMPPSDGAPAMGAPAPSDDPFGAPPVPAMGAGADDPFMMSPPDSPATPSN